MSEAISFCSSNAKAQVIPDGSLGTESSIVAPQATNSSVDVIQGGATRGTNVFHSFEQFSIPTGGTAYFNNALDIQNIFSRVTGTSISNIDGLIQANGAANLFLLNPHGIIFGPNASLNIGGSFLGSTATNLNFADGNQFSATAAQTTPLLTVSVPLGLQFGGTAGGIQVQQSLLQVQNGQTLALIGGDVSVEGGKFGFLKALGGRIELGGLAGAGMVEIEGQQSDGAFGLTKLRFPDAVERADVSLTNSARVNVAASGGGSIAINARNIDISGSSVLRGGIETNLGFPGAIAGDIELRAQGAIKVAGGDIFNNVRTGAVGNGGDIKITTGSLSVTDGAQLSASTFGQGDTGSVNINARDTVSFDGVSSDGWVSAAFSDVGEKAEGNGGDINVTSGSLSVTNGAQLQADTEGQGDAGSVNINARDTVSFDGVGNGLNTEDEIVELSSAAFSDVGEKAEGNGGDINITSGSLSVTNGAYLQADTEGQGDAGSVNINARDTVSFNYGDAFSDVGEGAEGNGGDINITTGSLSVTNGAQLLANTLGEGNAGSVNINARDTVSFDGMSSDGWVSAAFSRVGEEAVGNSGDINITTGSLSVTDGAQLIADTLGEGNAGSVNINARDAVSFDDGNAFSDVGEKAEGNAGGINITTGSLSVTNGAQLQADTEGEGNAGSVNINARDTVSFDGVGSNRLPSAAFSDVGEKAEGSAGGINITTGSLSVTNGAQLQADTQGEGNAGSVNINARDTVSFDGVGNGLNTEDKIVELPSAAFSRVGEEAVGNGGNINITTGSLSVTDGAQLLANTLGEGNAGSVNINARDTVSFDYGDAFSSVGRGAVGDGGDINITTGSLSVTDGAWLSASTLGEGNAGSVNINARDTVSFDGVSSDGWVSAAFSDVGEGAVGNGGDINITTDSLSVTDGAQLSTSSAGRGAAGNIEVKAHSIFMENQAILSSDTIAGQGNIILRSQDLVLRRDSRITTNATGTATGGNIIIDTGVIAALENSDITANADAASGGQVRINAQGIFGTEFRNQSTSESDITATSTLGPQFSGTVEINTSNVDLNQGLINLPVELVNVEGLIANSCIARRSEQRGSFTITGKGGLPTRPGEAAVSTYPTGTVRSIPSNDASPSSYQSSSVTSTDKARRWKMGDPIVEPQGVYRLANGELVLSRECSYQHPLAGLQYGDVPTDFNLTSE